jgi:sulfofructose kinase
VFHGAFTLALAQGCALGAAIRFAAAAAGLKCARLGGSMGPLDAARSRLCWRGRPRANLSCRRKLF